MANPALTIDITAATDKFKAGMSDIGDMADKTMSDIQSQFASFDPKLNTEAFTQSIVGMASIFGAAGVAVGGLITLVVSLNHSLAEMADTSDRVGLSFEKFQELKFGANSLGISDSSFTTSLDALATKLQDAKFQENELTRLFKAQPGDIGQINVKVQSMSDLLTKVVDVIKRAPSLQDALQIGAMAGITKDFSQQIYETGENFDKLASQAKDAGAVLDNETVEKARDFDREWTKATANFSTGMRSALDGILPLMKDLLDGVTTVTELMAGLYQIAVKLGSVGNEALPQLLDPHNFVGQGDDLLKTFDQIIAKAKEADAAKQGAISTDPDTGLNKIVINKGPPSVNPGPSKGDDSDSVDAFDRASESITKHTNTVIADTAAVFQNKSVQAELRAEFQLLNAIRQDDGEVTQEQIDKYEKLRATMSAQQALTGAGITLTKEHAEAFDTLTTKIGTATKNFDDARESLQKINSASSQLGSSLASAFSESIVQGDKLNVVLSNLLKSLANLAINSAFGSIFNAPSGGGLSPFASLFKGAFSGGGGFSATASTASQINGLGLNFGSLPAFASGTDFAAGGPSIVGENGPELVNLPRGSQVIPNDVASRATGSSSTPVIINNNNTFNNADPSSEARIKAYVDQVGRSSVQQAVQAVQTTKSNKPSYLR